MKTLILSLLPTTTFGTPSGNYDGAASSFSGVPQKAAAYYSKLKKSQTISWYLTGLVAIVNIEATLDDNSATSNYFTIHTIGDGVNPLTENDFTNLEGNYTWIRVTVTNFTAGTISKVSLGY